MSRVNFGTKPVMYPMPVLIIATYDENGVPDAMNAAWVQMAYPIGQFCGAKRSRCEASGRT